MEPFSSYPKCQKCGGYTDPKWDHIIGCCVCEIDAWEPLFPPPKERIGYASDGSDGITIVDIHPDMSVVYLPTSLQPEANVASLPKESLGTRLSPEPEKTALRKKWSSPFTNPKKTILKFIKKDWDYLVTAFGQKPFSLGIFYSRFGDWWGETYGTAKTSPKIFTTIEVHDILSSLISMEGFPKKGWTYAEKLFYRTNPSTPSLHSDSPYNFLDFLKNNPLPGYLRCEICGGSGLKKDVWEKCENCSGKRMLPGPQRTQMEVKKDSHQSLPEDFDDVNLRLLDKTCPPKRAVLEFIKDQWQDLVKEDRDDDLIPVIAPGENTFSLNIFYSRFSYWWKEATINIPCFTRTEVHDALKSLTYADGFPEGWSYIKAEKLFYRLPIPPSVPSAVSATKKLSWDKYKGKRIAFVQELEQKDSDDSPYGVLYRDTDSMFIEVPKESKKYKALIEMIKGENGNIPSFIYPKSKPS